jgi:hypothetical protein
MVVFFAFYTKDLLTMKPKLPVTRINTKIFERYHKFNIKKNAIRKKQNIYLKRTHDTSVGDYVTSTTESDVLAGCKIQVEGKKTQEAIKPSFMPIMILCM